MTKHVDWKPITDLPETLKTQRNPELQHLASEWQAFRVSFDQATEQRFIERLNRQIAIETGIIERLYSLDRGVTQNLIEQGLDVALIPHGNDLKPQKIISLVTDQQSALDHVFHFVGHTDRELSPSFIKQLHQLITNHQDYTEAIDPFGQLGNVSLIKGDWKKMPNNPMRGDTLYEYCPPEQVQSEMERLLEFYRRHMEQGVSPDVSAAWFHHRFTQIHPFQDGNGRVVRLLASLIFIKQGWFPLLVTRDDRSKYIEALEKADDGDLQALIDLFALSQKKLFLSSLSLEQPLTHANSALSIIASVAERLKQEREVKRMREEKNLQDILNKLGAYNQKAFEDKKAEISHQIPNITIFTQASSINNDYYFQWQIIEVAKHKQYFANLNNIRSWTRLSIHIDENRPQVNLIASMHQLGYTPRDTLVVTVFAFTREKTDDDKPVDKDIEALIETPFTFSMNDDSDEVLKRYQGWLDEALLLGLAYWAKRVG
jgi:Fic family protein